ncbi:MAG: (Fe-S)-binding protein [Anaerolineae bacterium]|nr:(Fe-S)-binding protein [Anaerolineae bacterium]
MVARKEVSLFVTCLVDQVIPEVGVAAVRLLRRAGYQVAFPQEQTCCGQPFFNSGFQEQARTLAARTVDIFADAPAVVLPSGSCTTMIRKEYPHLLAGNPRYAYRARRLARKSFELSEFLLHQAGWQPPTSTPRGAVTYHDSCHMCRMLGLGAEPRLLLAQTGHELVEMAEPDRCCGFGGVFSIRMPEISNAMTTDKLDQAADTGAPLLVTADPGCLLQMRGLAGEKGPSIQHLATVLEEATR